MFDSYPGPLRGQPLSIELHNTRYATTTGPCDGIADTDGLCAWLQALRAALVIDPASVDPARLPDFHALRAAVREAVAARLAGAPVPTAARAALNAASAAAPRSAALDDGGVACLRHHAGDAATVVLAVIAADAIALLGGPGGQALRACGAPGCVLVFVRDHPRRTWCSDACGNRARQARHYARQRRL